MLSVPVLPPAPVTTTTLALLSPPMATIREAASRLREALDAEGSGEFGTNDFKKRSLWLDAKRASCCTEGNRAMPEVEHNARLRRAAEGEVEEEDEQDEEQQQLVTAEREETQSLDEAAGRDSDAAAMARDAC